jgi:iron complex outermembrane receptor protein
MEWGGTMKMGIKQYALVTTALTGAMFATSVLAQDATPSPSAQTSSSKAEAAPGAVSEVVVVGIRRSLQKSLELKRSNDSQIDVITAEDVTKFPDTNVAEALSRLPGVTIDHSDGGEGNKVAILGIDSRLILTEMDGNALATSSVGVDDHTSGRSFNFINLAPEIIGDVEVYKSTQAKLDEGGVGGTINVNTRRPLDLPANTGSISANYNYNLRTEDGNPRGSLFYSWRNDNHTFGVLGLVAYNKLELGGTGVSVTSNYETACDPALGWGGCTNGKFNNPSLLPTVTKGPAITPNTLVPRNIDSGSSIQTEERLTYDGAVQWRPVHDLEFYLTGYLVHADDSSYSQAMLSNVGVNWDDRNGYGSVDPVTNATNYPITYTSVTTNGAGVTGGVMSHIAERLDMQYNHQVLDTKAFNFKSKWTPGPWKIELNVGATTATGGVSPQYYLSFYGHTSATWSLSQNSSYLKTGDPLTDPTLFQSRATGQQAGFVETAKTLDDIEYARIDASRDVNWFDWVKKLEFGFKFENHTNGSNGHFYNTVVNQVGTLADFPYVTSPASLVDGLGANGDLRSYVYLTQSAMQAYSVANRNPGHSAGSPFGDYNKTGVQYHTAERETATYFQADFRHGAFHGDAGVRVVTTENKQAYFSSQNYYPWIQDFVHTKNHYTDVLPAANFVYDLPNNQDIRFTVAKVMSRPSFADQSGEVDYNFQTRTGGGGNPNLGPYRSTNYGASYEWYFAPHSIISADFFYRDVSQYTVYNNVLVSITPPPGTLAYCNQGVGNGGVPACPGMTSPVDILLNTPYNANNAKVKGVSLDYQGDLKWGFGLQSNVTWLDQQFGALNNKVSVTGNDSNGPITTTATNGAMSYPLPYLSKWSYTIAPYYEHGPWQIHLSYTWRSKYNTTATNGAGGNELNYVSAFGQMDGSITYMLNKKLQITASATNILDPMVKPFTTGGLPLGWSKYGTRVSMGLMYKFN